VRFDVGGKAVVMKTFSQLEASKEKKELLKMAIP
jgi:hypothetical protein